MAVLEIIKFPDKLLRQKARAIGAVTDVERKLARDMFDTMYFANGVGLAAPQIGLSRRIIVCNPTGIKKDEMAIINPVITPKKGAKVRDCEGCLSVPEITGEVARFFRIGVKGKDLEGQELSFEAEGLLARVIQHETDHLDGILFIDRLGFLKRKMLMAKYKKKMGLSCVGRWY